MAQRNPNGDFTTIVISGDTHRRLAQLPFALHAESNAVTNPDGSVSLRITRDLHARLQTVHDDPEEAIQCLLAAG